MQVTSPPGPTSTVLVSVWLTTLHIWDAQIWKQTTATSTSLPIQHSQIILLWHYTDECHYYQILFSQHCWWRIKYTTMLCHVDFFNSWHSTTSKKTSIFSVIILCHTLYICNGKYITSCLSFTNISIATTELKSSCHPSYTWWFNSCMIKGEHTKNKRAKTGTRWHDSHMTLSGSKKEIMHTGHHKAGTAGTLKWSDYMTGNPRFKSQQKQEILLSSETSRPTLGPTQPLFKWVQGALTSGAKTFECEDDHSPSSIA